MSKQVNIEWMNELLNNEKSNTKKDFNNMPKIDWVSGNKAFKRLVRFKAVPANSKENNIFAWKVATHWNLGPNDKRFICPEQTLHLKKQGIKCPICEAKRKLLSMGFKEEELCKQGKYGMISLFDPNVTSNIKAVVCETDIKSDWDKSHISILQQNKSYMSIWLVKKYNEQDTPDFLSWENSNIIKFSRDSDAGLWTREPTFATMNFSSETIEKLKEENEALYMPDVWPMPSDQDLLEVQSIADEMVENFIKAKETQKEAVEDDFDDIPF